MNKIQLASIVALAMVAAGCASHQYTRNDITDPRMFKQRLKLDNAVCKGYAKGVIPLPQYSGTSGGSVADSQGGAVGTAPAAAGAAEQKNNPRDSCMLSLGWHHKGTDDAAHAPASTPASSSNVPR